MHRLVTVLALTFGIAACGARRADGGRPTWTPPISATPEVEMLERQMWRRLNADRARAGRAPLAFASRLSDIARGHSLDMRDGSFFDHVSPRTGDLERRLDVAGYVALEMRENLALAPTVDRAQDNLLESPGHRANIMAGSVTHLGVGIVASERGLFVTQVFTRPAQVQTPALVESGVRGRLAALPRAAPLVADARLSAMAADELSNLPDVVPDDAAVTVGARVVKRLEAQPGHGLGAVAVAVQSVYGVDDFEPPQVASQPRSQRYGLATASGRDDRGRPRVRILLLVTQDR